MITVIAKATDKNAINDLLRSLINNAEDKNSFEILVDGGAEYAEVVDRYQGEALVEFNQPTKSYYSTLIWTLTDSVFVLGQQWDKRIRFYQKKFPDGIVAMLPSGYRNYREKSEEEVLVMAERNPVVSDKWVELAGTDDVEMVCRSLFLRHNIDRRIDIRLVDLQYRGAVPVNEIPDMTSVDARADAIANYINSKK